MTAIVPRLSSSEKHIQPQTHSLQRTMSERITSSFSTESDFELRRRRSSDTLEDDDYLISSSPPPNLTEYRQRCVSEEKQQEKPNLTFDRQMTWQSLLEEFKYI